MAQAGYKVTPSVIERLKKARLAIKNRKHSEATKRKLSLANKGNPKLKVPKPPFTEEPDYTYWGTQPPGGKYSGSGWRYNP